MALTVLGVLAAVAAEGYRRLREGIVVDRAARAVMGDVTLARSFAVQRQRAAVLAADESGLAYAVLDTSGGSPDTLYRRSFGEGSEVPLSLLDVQAPGDRLVFDERGLLVAGGGLATGTIELGRDGDRRRVVVSPLGRTRMETPP